LLRRTHRSRPRLVASNQASDSELVNGALDAGEAHFQSPAGHGPLGRQNG